MLRDESSVICTGYCAVIIEINSYVFDESHVCFPTLVTGSRKLARSLRITFFLEIPSAIDRNNFHINFSFGPFLPYAVIVVHSWT